VRRHQRGVSVRGEVPSCTHHDAAQLPPSARTLHSSHVPPHPPLPPVRQVGSNECLLSEITTFAQRMGPRATLDVYGGMVRASLMRIIPSC
jgi:hypothetical protein